MRGCFKSSVLRFKGLNCLFPYIFRVLVGQYDGFHIYIVIDFRSKSDVGFSFFSSGRILILSTLVVRSRTSFQINVLVKDQKNVD